MDVTKLGVADVGTISEALHLIVNVGSGEVLGPVVGDVQGDIEADLGNQVLEPLGKLLKSGSIDELPLHVLPHAVYETVRFFFHELTVGQPALRTDMPAQPEQQDLCNSN